jgi:hypothetical protein
MRYYLDTEFDGFGGALLSMALVREDGESWYAVHGEPLIRDAWVRLNVAPILFACDVPTGRLERPDVQASLAWFLRGDPDPVIVTDWPADIRYFCQYIELPGGNMLPIPALKFELHRVDAYPTTLVGAVQHNAWWDAMALREKLTGDTGNTADRDQSACGASDAAPAEREGSRESPNPPPEGSRETRK